MSTVTRSLISLSREIAGILAALIVLQCALYSQSVQAPPQAAGGAAVTGPKFRVLRSVSGTSGTEKDDRLVIDNPKTIFHLGQDHKIMVYFEWEGPVGPHKFEGLWKNPAGKVVIISDFQYSATTTQFAGYWTMLLSGSEPTGVWTLEARIDGEAAGSFPFQVVSEPGAEPPTPPPARQPLTPAEIYQRALAASVYVDKFDARGKPVGRGSGFYLGDGRLVTAFQNIDGAKQVRVVFGEGRTIEATQVLARNRWQDWAVLPVNAPKVAGLPRAHSKSWTIGTVAYYLEVSTGSSRVITDTTIVGENTFPRAGDRLNLSASPDRAAIGSPLLNEYGEVIGMVGGSLAPGTNLLESYLLAMAPSNAGGGGILRYGLAVPVTLIPAASDHTAPATFDELTHNGEMLPLLTAPEKVAFGEFVLTLDKHRGMLTSRGSRQQFSHRDGKIYVYVNWDPNTKFKGVATMALFDVENRLLGQSKPLKVNLHFGEIAAGIWNITPASLPSGTYRVDVSLGDDLVWRRFFRLTD